MNNRNRLVQFPAGSGYEDWIPEESRSDLTVHYPHLRSWFDTRDNVGLRFELSGETPFMYVLQLHKSKATYSANDFYGFKKYSNDTSEVEENRAHQTISPSPSTLAYLPA